MTGFNLRSIQTVDTYEHQVRDHEGNLTPVIFTLAGPTHKVRKDGDYALRRKLLARAKKSGTVDMPDPETQDAENTAAVARGVLGWQNFTDESGQPVPYSPEAAMGLLSAQGMQWLLVQIDREMNNAANFTKRV